MRASFVVTSPNQALATVWQEQLPWAALQLEGDDALRRELQNMGPRVWVRDIASRREIVVHPDTVVIGIGEPQTPAFEGAKRSHEFAYCLSYEESRTNLGGLAKLAAELAEKKAALGVMEERWRDRPLPPPLHEAQLRSDEFDYIEAAIANLSDGARVIEEFKRAARSRLQAQRVAVFLRHKDAFVAEPEGWRCPVENPFVSWIERNGAMVDSASIATNVRPETEAAVRGELSRWNARMIIPVEAEGVLRAWIAFGPRCDGRAYSSRDVEEGVRFGRLLAALGGQKEDLEAAKRMREEIGLIQRYGPKFAVFDDAGAIDSALPIEAREIASIARRKGKRAERDYGRIRVAAGPIPETGGVWVTWEERDLALEQGAAQREKERFATLNDLGIMLSHEMANRLSSVFTYFHSHLSGANPDDKLAPLRDQVRTDLDRLKAMPHILSALHEMAPLPTEEVDLSEVIKSVAQSVRGNMDIPPGKHSISGHGKYLMDALVWLIDEIRQNSKKPDVRTETPFKISLRARQGDEDSIYLIIIAYPGLRLDQLKLGEVKSVAEYPTVPVFLAREIIRWHLGTIHVGQGLSGPELKISLRSRKEGVEPRDIELGPGSGDAVEGTEPNSGAMSA